ncbi:HATPase_c domain protein [Seminavis robusta]|uniref:HATPase_c domain protein n=1 Tax=Seminavis robusta TaxID=568900 RepID=A0A9N8D880_9STRA|nr:HATPase_c domain protein [Seminavis robusta]|eukprot:Sro37_g023240.1 HATPase_c domain protein (1861) ;mRNA; r:78503-84870
MSADSLYSAVRAEVNESGADSRVEVNQRALIDKILARYASAGAVYRELLQNSNDADATNAEVHFTTNGDMNQTVTQVMYRNNGWPFRDQDWARLKKIAEGNPDVSKVGAFGVGAYTMFSICEEPLVMSGDQALAFMWRGDALWTKTATNVENSTEMGPGGRPWTTFLLPSRDPYALPSMVEFGQFLCASLTFTRCLRNIRVFVDGNERIFIQKTQIKEPTLITPPQSSSWFSNDGAVTASSQGTFYLNNNNKSINESIFQFDVLLDGDASSIQARYVSAVAKTRIGSQMATRMERVTKKKPPKEVNVEIFLNAGGQQHDDTKKQKNKADKVTESFSPQMGKGRIFIGFRTSQTTGLAAHLAAPFVPTVEREAIDLQDPTLRTFNSELLEFSGILMRLSLEHAMSLLEVEWKESAPAREKTDKEIAANQFKAAADAKASSIAKKVEQDDIDQTESDDAASTTSGGLFGFAKFMAKGITKQIVSVVTTAAEILDDGSAYLNPQDPRPLCAEERQAILLMQSFCPEQSTPDPLVGMNLANGFSRCMPNMAPPVLTRSGVVRGDQARLPNQGMESFVQNNVIRKVVYMNCEQYHDVIARCRKITLEDVAIAIADDVLEQPKLVFFLNWWTRYSHIDPHGTRSRGESVKDSIVFYTESGKADSQSREMKFLRDLLFYVEKEGPLSDPALPMPPSALPNALRDDIGMRTITDDALQDWFSPVPVEIWMDFMSAHPCLNKGQPEDDKLRLTVLTIFNKEYHRRYGNGRQVFGGFCKNLLSDKRCIPFDSNEPTQFAADFPGNLYLYSAELKAFDGMGSFHKVSKALNSAGITDEFLLELGVRKSIAIEFLFENLDTLKWSKDPKPLVEYLRSASLTNKDVNMLRQTQYLPAENDESRTFAPSELFLPDPDLRLFPFCRLLQWPSEDSLAASSPNGKFLKALGCHVRPSLETVLHYTSERVKDDETRIKCLDYLSKRMGPHGVYQQDYNRLSGARRAKFKIMPCIRLSFLQPDAERSELCSPVECYADVSCGIMCYPVVDPKLASSDVYATIFQCPRSPKPDKLLDQLLVLVQLAKKMSASVESKNKKELSDRILKTFSLIFQFLSNQTADFDKTSLVSLRKVSFIPIADEEGIVEWYRPDQVFFRSSNGESDSLTELLFKAVEYSSFLSAVGVKSEASARDLFLLLLRSPQDILDTLGEKKYRLLLRRLAANPPFTRVSPQIRSAPFLLAYTSLNDNPDDSKEKPSFKLAKAEDIFIIDNSFFGRMFPGNRAPHESDLEDFYILIGSSYISKVVEKRFEIVGRAVRNTSLVKALQERINERTPLLVSPHVTSRALVPNAHEKLDNEKLSLFEADGLLAVFTLGRAERRQRTTCCSRQLDKRKNALYVTKDLDFFDVGQSIGDLILERCQLEDAFFIASLLEAPLEQLRARGFPVDRVLKPKLPPQEPKKPEPTPPPQQSKPNNEAKKTVGAHSVQPGSSTAAANSGGTASNGTSNSKGSQDSSSNQSADTDEVLAPDEIMTMVQQMFPDADEKFLKEKMGSKPNLDDVRRLAEQMSTGNYPRRKNAAPPPPAARAPQPARTSEQEALVPDPEKPAKKGKAGGLKNSLGRAFGSFRGGGGGSVAPTAAAASAVGGMQNQHQQMGPSTGTQSANTDAGPVSPEHDASAHSNMESMLENAAAASAPVNTKGVESVDTVMTSVPAELDRGSTCEIIPGQSLKAFPGPRGDGKTHNGVCVFSARNSPESDSFLRSNEDAIEKFALVLKRLASVYEIDPKAVAIFHDPRGGTIAFNANRSLHFNLRFFHALHYLQNKYESYDCYSYWFVVFAHELSHNLVSGHNKEHGFYTESYVSKYLPKFCALMTTLPRNF